MKRRLLFAPLLALALALPLGAAAQNMVKLKAGMVTGIDQVGLPRPRAWDALIEDVRFKALAAQVLQQVRAA